MRSLTDAEAERVLSAATSRPPGQQLVLRLLLEYELTAHEICRLTPSDFTGSGLLVRDKRDEPRTVELRADASAELAVLPMSESGQLLAAGSSPLRPEAIMRLLSRAALDAELDGDVSIHRARRPADTRA